MCMCLVFEGLVCPSPQLLAFTYSSQTNSGNHQVQQRGAEPKPGACFKAADSGSAVARYPAQASACAVASGWGSVAQRSRAAPSLAQAQVQGLVSRSGNLDREAFPRWLRRLTRDAVHGSVMQPATQLQFPGPPDMGGVRMQCPAQRRSLQAVD